MVFHSWTRTHLLVLCFFLISYLIYLVGLCCMVDSTWINGVPPHTPFLSSTDEALLVLYAILSWELSICVSGLLYMQMRNRCDFELSTICAFFGVICFVFVGDLSLSRTRDVFSTLFPANASSNSAQTPSVHPGVVLAWIGTLLKGLSWLLFIVLAIVKPNPSQDTQTQESKITTFYMLRRMIILMLSLYYSVVTWTMLVSKMVPDFVPSTYTMYTFFPCLISLAISECIEDVKLSKGVFLSFISVFVTFLIKSLLDLAGTTYHCSSYWTQQCIEQNPIYYSTVISCTVAGTLLWMCIIELRLFTGDPSNSEDKFHLPAVLDLEEGYLKSPIV